MKTCQYKRCLENNCNEKVADRMRRAGGEAETLMERFAKKSFRNHFN